MTAICVIFDLDGTLVDSESLCNQAFLDLLPDIGDSVEDLVHRYRGKKLAVILADLAARRGKPLPSDFELRYRDRVAHLFDTHLLPTPGTVEMLHAIPFAKCVASSGPRAKIARALEVTGLSSYFGHALFSSYDVGSWKPEPGLFLRAADAMGFQPESCVVVEDSDVGVQAAIAAGMMALRYSPEHDRRASPVINFSHMDQLPRLLGKLQAEGNAAK